MWDQHVDPFSTAIEVYVRRLRLTIDRGHTVKLLQTKRGLGYTLTATVGR